MPGLISKPDLEHMGFLWDARRKLCDFKELDIADVTLAETMPCA